MQALIQACESYYHEHGYVKWSDIAAQLGVSRQAVAQRLKTACKNGEISSYTYKQWRPQGSTKSKTIKPLLTPPNYQWVEEETMRLNIDVSELINYLISEKRKSK